MTEKKHLSLIKNQEKPMDIPFSSEAEAQLLGAIMRENSLIDNVNFLSEEHFYAPVHQRIFAACRKKISNGELVTPITMASAFKSTPDLPASYLAQCVASAAPNLFAFNQIARYVKDLAQRRELISQCQKAMDELLDQGNQIVPIATALSGVCDRIMAGDRRFEMKNGAQVTQNIVDSMNAGSQPFPTGIKRLDKAMDGGVYAGKLYGFAGKKKYGKTILAGTISVNLAVNGVKHLFICGEMSSEEIQQRNLARMGKFFPTVFRNDSNYSRSEDFKNRFNEAMQWQQQNIIFSNAPALTFDKLKSIVKQAILKHGIKGFILDYWQLVGGKENKKSTAEHLDEVAQWLADTAKKHNLFVIAMAQINQEGNTRGGEGLRLACDQLYQIQRPDITQSGMWLEMMDTRYTAWMNIGSDDSQVMNLNPKGPYFEEDAL